MNPLTVQRHPSTYRFPLPNAIWQWHLKSTAFAILAYLQYRSCRKIHGAGHAYKNEYPNGGATSGRSGRPGTRNQQPAPNLVTAEKRKLFHSTG